MDIILLHGALGSKEQFAGLGKVLKKAGYKVHAINFSGHGVEPFRNEGFGIKIFSWELQNYIRSKKLEKPKVFGYSMGGYVALRLAFKFPEVLGDIFTLGTKFDWNPKTAEKEAKMLDAKNIESKVPAFAAKLKKLHGADSWKDLVAKTAEMLTELGDEPLLTKNEFSGIKNKVIIAVGDEDTMVTKEESEKAAKALPNGKFQLLKKTPHEIEKVEVSKIAELFSI